MTAREHLFIGGSWTAPSTGATVEVVSPHTEEVLATVPMALLDAFADIGDAHRWEETRPGRFGGEVLLRTEPVGVAVAVVPWNMPQFLIAGLEGYLDVKAISGVG